MSQARPEGRLLVDEVDIRELGERQERGDGPTADLGAIPILQVRSPQIGVPRPITDDLRTGAARDSHHGGGQ